MSLVWTLDPGAAAGRYEAAGGGSGSVIGISFDFAFDDPGLSDGILVPGYVPQAGDVVMMETQFLVTTAWDGTTPMADVFFDAAAVVGYFGKAVTAWDMTATAVFEIDSDTAVLAQISSTYYQIIVAADGDGCYVAVSQDGHKGGDDPGATHGEATLKLGIFRPA